MSSGVARLLTRHLSLDTRPSLRFDFFGAVSYSYPDSSLIPAKRGAVAQLGERLNGIQEVVGSIPIGSTMILNSLWPTDRPEDSQL